MIPSSKRGAVFASAFSPVGELSRRIGHLLVNALQSAYDSHMERAQMRLTPVKFRSWREIARIKAHHDSW
jgi:hypothetical protein